MKQRTLVAVVMFAIVIALVPGKFSAKSEAVSTLASSARVLANRGYFRFAFFVARTGIAFDSDSPEALAAYFLVRVTAAHQGVSLENGEQKDICRGCGSYDADY